MATVTKDLGVATAYGYAKNKGYTGTEAEFETLMYDMTKINRIDSTAPVIINTSDEAEVVTFADGADDMPLKALRLNILPHQSGSGDPSPSNVRPISGYSTVEVTRVGKNLLPMTLNDIKRLNTTGTWNGNAYTHNGITFTVLTDTAGHIEKVTANGTATAQATLKCAQFASKSGINYILSGCPSGGGGSTYRIGWGYHGYDSGNGLSSAGANDLRDMAIEVYQNYTANNLTFTPMIRLASDTDPTYEPYTGNTYPVTLPQTVYGGELDVVSGKLKVTKASYIMDTITQVGWNGALLYIDLSKAPLNKSDTSNVLCVCSHAQGVSNEYFYRHQSEDALASVGTARQLRYRNLSIEQTATAYNAYFAQQIANGTPVTFVYEIATPIEITLDPTTIKTLLGTNVIWMSADGTIQADYCADTKMYIDALTAPDEDMVANTNIASGKYFTVNNKLYISTSAIAQGEQIVVGTNCNQTDLATALNAINA